MFIGGKTVFQSSIEEMADKGGLESNFLRALEGDSND